jgi:hypothetical protein
VKNVAVAATFFFAFRAEGVRMDEYVVRQSQFRQFCIVLAGVALTAATIFLYHIGRLALFYALPVTVFFGGCMLFCLWRFVFPKPVLVITKSGFTNNSSLVGGGFVPWEKVENIWESVVEVAGTRKRFISVQVADEKRTRAIGGMPAGYRKIDITLQSAKAEFADVMEVMLRRWGGFREERGE